MASLEEEDGENEEEDTDMMDTHDVEEDPDAEPSDPPVERGASIGVESEVIPLDPADGR